MKTYTCVKCNKEFKQAYLRRDKPYCSRKCRRRDVTQCLNPDCHVEIPKIKGRIAAEQSRIRADSAAKEKAR